MYVYIIQPQKTKILLLATVWMDLEGIMLNEISQGKTNTILSYLSVQFNSVAQLCPILREPMDRSTPGRPVHHELPEFTQTYIHWIGDAIQPSHPLLTPSPLSFNLSQHQSLFKLVCSSHQEVKVLEFQLQHQSFQWTPKTDLL